MTTKAILFDIGNVIASDYWEALWLTQKLGLADELGVPVIDAKEIGLHLWSKYSVKVAAEEDYWQDWSKAIGRQITPNTIQQTERRVIRANPFVKDAIKKLLLDQVVVGVISNNTSFWYSKQLTLAGIADLIEPRNMFLSCNYGVEKRRRPLDLFEIAAQTFSPPETAIIDDREENVRFAKTLGFKALFYGNGESVEAEPLGYCQPIKFFPLRMDVVL